jgi:hypothetical protein
MRRHRRDTFDSIEIFMVRLAALTCLLANLFKVVRHELGF